jgi:hypothetical protein
MLAPAAANPSRFCLQPLFLLLHLVWTLNALLILRLAGIMILLLKI